MKKYFEFNDGKSNKYWSITVDAHCVKVQYGKVGTSGQTQEKFFNSEEEAIKEANKLVKSKTSKGYVEAPLPAGLSEPTPKEVLPKIISPKPKLHTLADAGADVKDEGQKLPWHDEDDYCYGDDDSYPFDMEYLRQPEVVDVQPKKGVKAEPEAAKHEAPTDFDMNAYKKRIEELDSTIRRGRGAAISEQVDVIKKLNPGQELFKKDLIEILYEQVLDDNVFSISFHHIDFLVLLVAEGIDVPAVLEEYNKKASHHKYKENLLKKFFIHMFAFMREKPRQASEVLNEAEKFFTDLYGEATKRIVKQLEGLVEKIKAGKQKEIEGTKLSESIYGFKLNVDYKLSIYTIGKPSETLSSEDFKRGDDLKGQLVKRFMTPLIKPELERMVKNGFFNDIVSSGYFRVSFYGDTEPLIEMRLNPEHLEQKAKELEKNIQYLENSVQWNADAKLLEETFRTYFEPNGVIEQRDTDRMLGILKRYLYCGEKDAEEAALSMLHKYDNHDYAKWTYEFVLYQWENLDFNWSIGRMRYLVDDYAYEPAKAKIKEWSKLQASKGTVSDDDEEDDEEDVTVNYEKVYGYGNAANRARHRDTFKESDLFFESDNVIIRAYSTGHIFIRFKEESENAYRESLDFLNKLMAKGYSNVHDGYELSVRFLAQPIFFEEMNSYMWPSNDSHAFFAKAVRYPALRERVAEFARLTLKEYDRYHNLDGEYSTVAGTFAAVAVAMSDIKYMDVAVEFAEETDGEHEELASHFSDILDDYYGVTPETAVAIAMLRISYDHDDFGLSDDFYKYPENLQAVMDYFNGTRMHHESHKIVRVMENIFDDTENALKKLKKLFQGAGDPADKVIYADAHDWLLAAAQEEEDESFGKPISYIAPKKEVEKPIVDETGVDFTENPPCVISLDEVQKRGYTQEQLELEDDAGWLAFIFGPAVITNPYHYDIFWANIKKLFDIKAVCHYVQNPDMVYTFRKCALDLQGAPYQFGMAIFDKKKMEVIYGLMDYAAIAAKLTNKPADKAKMLELRQQYLIELGDKGSPRHSPDMPGLRLLDDAISAKIKEKYMRVLMKLNQITPEMGDVYDAALIIKGDIYKRHACAMEAKEAYAELAKRKPEFKEYWDARLKEQA